MKYISLLVLSVFILSACNTSAPQSGSGVISKNSDAIVDVKDETLIGTDCSVESQKAQESLLEANTNPNIDLEFLGSAYSSSTASCLLKVKIINKTEGSQSISYNLFNVVSERTYKSFSTLEDMQAVFSEE